MMKKLEQARMEAVATKSPVTAKFIKAFIDFGMYDPTVQQYYLSLIHISEPTRLR